MHKENKTTAKNECATPMEDKGGVDVRTTDKELKSATNNAWTSANRP